MNFLCKCETCEEMEWLRGSDDPETDSFEVDGELSCGHDLYEVVDSEYESLVGDEVI